ncbi:MAG: GNAT family N-acetyltransferase [Verrucomicrobiota bacterium]
MKIETYRLTLRPFRPDEFGWFHAVLSDPRAMAFSYYGPLQPEFSAQLFQQFQVLQQEKGFSPWAVCNGVTGQFIGLCGIQEIELNGTPKHEVTFRILPEHWGNGYGAEAAGAAYRFAFEGLFAEEVVSVINPQNSHAIAVATANGLKASSETTVDGHSMTVYSQSISDYFQFHGLLGDLAV